MKVVMIKFFIFLGLTWLGISTYFVYGNPEISQRDPNYCRLVDEILNAHIKDMNTRGFAVQATGGSLNGDVRQAIVSFNSNQSPTIEQARQIYLEEGSRLLDLLNTDLRIRMYLHDFPSSFKNLRYSISFKEMTIDDSQIGPINFVFNIEDTICYSVLDPNHLYNPLKTIWRETVPQAFQEINKPLK